MVTRRMLVAMWIAAAIGGCARAAAPIAVPMKVSVPIPEPVYCAAAAPPRARAADREPYAGLRARRHDSRLRRVGGGPEGGSGRARSVAAGLRRTAGAWEGSR